MQQHLCSALVAIIAILFWASYFFAKRKSTVTDRYEYEKGTESKADSKLTLPFAIAFTAITVIIFIIELSVK